MSLKSGDKLKLNNKYVIESEIGDGGFGSVFKAKDLKNGNIVAIKLFKSEAFASPAETRMYWEREYKLCENVNGYTGPRMDYIEAYEDKTDRAHPKFYIVLGFVEYAETLKKWFNDNLRKPAEEQLGVDKMIEYIFLPLLIGEEEGNLMQPHLTMNLH